MERRHPARTRSSYDSNVTTSVTFALHPDCTLWEICPFSIDGMCPAIMTKEDEEFLQDVYKIYSITVLSFAFFCIFFGVLGNVVTLLVLRSRSLREKFISTLIAYECAINILELFIGLGRIIVLKTVGIDYRLLSEDLCNLQHGLFFTCHMVEHWCIVFLVLTRFVYMVRPEKALYYLKVNYAHLAMVSTVILCGLLNFTVAKYDTSYLTVYHYGTTFNSCKWSTSGYLFFSQMTMFFYLPAAITVMINIVCYAHYRRALSGINQASGNFQRRRSKQKNAGLAIVKLIFYGNILFFVTACPFSVILPSIHELDSGGIRDRAFLYFGFKATVFLLYGSRAVWFVIYYMVGKRFRHQCRRLLMRCWFRFKKNVLRRPVADSEMVQSETQTHTHSVDEIGIIKERLMALGPQMDRQSYQFIFTQNGMVGNLDIGKVHKSVSRLLRKPSMMLTATNTTTELQPSSNTSYIPVSQVPSNVKRL